MYRRIWGCSPWKELDRDGLSEEIDESALLLGKKQRRRNLSEEEVGQRSWEARRACDGGGEQTGAPFIDETRRWRRGGRRWPGSASGVVRL